jgi:hypothetical protein
MARTVAPTGVAAGFPKKFTNRLFTLCVLIDQQSNRTSRLQYFDKPESFLSPFDSYRTILISVVPQVTHSNRSSFSGVPMILGFNPRKAILLT